MDIIWLNHPNAGRARRQQIRRSDEGGDGKGDGGEEAKDILYASEGVVHGGREWIAPDWRELRVLLVKDAKVAIAAFGGRGELGVVILVGASWLLMNLDTFWGQFGG